MRKKIILLLALVLSVGVLGACTKKDDNKNKDGGKKTEQNTTKKKVIATSTMLTDLVKQIGGDNFEVEGMMKAGVDPHLYKPTAGDVEKLEKADVVVVNGLHLEGQMGEILQGLEKQNKNVITASKNIPSDSLLPWNEEGAGPNDPHIWFSVKNWKIAAKNVAEGLKKADSSKAEEIDKNLAKYEKELDELSEYIKKKVSELPENQRVLVTAHDAFNYFAKEFGFRVEAIQGISTESEASAADIKKLSDFLVETKIKAVFVESSVPKKTIESLVESCKAKGHNVKIGGELYSDSLGDDNTKENTYISMFKYNIDTIVDALK